MKPKKSAKMLINSKLAIIIGHSNNHKGARMLPPYDFVEEYEYNTVLGATIKAIAESKEIDCKVILRDNYSISEAYKKAAQYDPGAIVELHFNAFTSEKAFGTETLFGHIPRSYELAGNIHNELCETLGRTLNGGGDRGIKLKSRDERGGLNLNNGTDIPTVIIEPFFGTNKNDSYLGLYHLRDIAEAVMIGFLNFTINENSFNRH